MERFDPDRYRGTNIYRKRLIPDECVHLKDDGIYLVSDELILTAWQALKPRADIAGGISALYPKLGVKVSKVFTHTGTTLEWYNDICEVSVNGSEILMTDLLLDVVFYPIGNPQTDDLSDRDSWRMNILDIDEFSEAIAADMITKEQTCRALTSFNKLICMIQSDNYDTLRRPVEELDAWLRTQGIIGNKG